MKLGLWSTFSLLRLPNPLQTYLLKKIGFGFGWLANHLKIIKKLIKNLFFIIQIHSSSVNYRYLTKRFYECKLNIFSKPIKFSPYNILTLYPLGRFLVRIISSQANLSQKSEYPLVSIANLYFNKN